MRRLSTRLALSVLVVLAFTTILNSSVLQVPTGTWRPISNMQSERANAVAVLVPDGRIVFAGGADANGNPTTSSEALSNDGTFSLLPPMTAARAGHAALLTAMGDLLVTGGRTSGGFVNTAEVFDSLRNTWTVLSPSMVQARAGHTMSQLLDGNILIAGGQDSSGPIAALETYSLTQGNFAFAGTLATARKNHAAAVLKDGRVLIIGGEDSNGATLASTEIYDPGTGTVAAGPNLATPRKGATATTLLDGRVLVLAGSYPEGASQQNPAELASAEIFDPSNETFTASASQLSTARANHLAVLLPNNNNVLIAGGTAAGADLASAELYVPWNDAFQQAGTMSAARSAATVSAMGNAVGDGADIGIDGMLAVAGGNNLKSGDMYGFASVKTDHTDYVPGDIVTITGSGWQPGETVNLSFLESPNIDQPSTLTAIADVQGNIVSNQFSPDADDLHVRFYLTAIGSQSRLQAQNTFTDAGSANVNFATIGLPSGASVTVNFNFTNNGGHTGSGSTTFTAPGPSANTGTQPLSSFSYTFPTSITVGSMQYNVSSSSPVSAFNTGVDKSVVTVTGTYVPAQQSQTITFNTLSSKTYGDADFTVSATASSGLAVGFGAVGSCTVSASTVHIIGAGFCTITASQAGNNSHSAAPDVSQSFNITQAAVTAKAGSYSNVYDGTSHSPSACAVTGTYTGDLTCANNPSSVGPGVGSGAVTPTVSGTGLSNFNITNVDGTWSITQAPTTTTVTCPASVTYNGQAQNVCTANVTGAGSLSQTLTVNYTNNTNAGTATASASFAGDANHAASNDTKNFTIDQAAVTAKAGSYSNVYDGTSHSPSACAVTGTYTGDLTCANNPSSVGPGVGSGAVTPTVSGTGLSNFNITNVDGTWSITQAPTTTTVTCPASVTYNGQAQNVCTANVTGAGSLSQTLTVNYTNNTNAGTATASASFAGDANHAASNDTKNFTIDQAAVTAKAGSYSNVYDGTSHSPSACAVTGTYTGDLTCANNPSSVGPGVGSGAVTPTVSGTGLSNFNITNVDGTWSITQAPTTTTVTCPASVTYNGQAQNVCTANVTGAGSLSQTLTVNYTNNTNAGTATASASFAGDANHTASNDTKNFTIAKANATITVTPYNVVYDGQPHTAAVTAKGALGENLSGVNLSGTTHTNPGDYLTDAWSFADVTGNYNNTSGTTHDNVHYKQIGTTCLGDLGHSILQPINTDGTSVFKQGSTVPAKFRVCDANGNSIGTTGVITSFVLYQVNNGTIAPIDETADNSTNDLGWRFDPSAQQWIYNMSTKIAPFNAPNKTYYFRITLNDGSTILFNFGLK